MTIGFITSEYPHANLKRSAGLGSSIKNLSKGLVSKGVKVVVFAVFQNKDKTFEDDGITIISMARKGHRFLGWYFERKHIEKRVKEEIKAHHIDVLEAPDWTGITAFMNFNVPLIIRLHGSDAYFCKLENRKQKWKHFMFEKNALNKADFIISVSDFAANVTRDIFKLKQEIITIYNGVNVTTFKPKSELIVKGRLLYFGTIVRKKGVLELAEIFNGLVDKKPDVSLVLIGKDAMDVFKKTSTLSLFNIKLNAEAKQRVEHINEVAYSEINSYIASAEIIVLPSFAEAFPMTWLEALAMEKPLVTSNIGWAKELMINNKTGYTIDPKNHNDYTNAILDLLNDETKQKIFGSNGRKHIIDNFSTEIVLEKNMDLFNQIMQQKSEA
ncbi:glycosyltransferase family 4 protein [Winogradskyella luteola]|uniref:Glycosyltransferase family 4 protein n=1 Tax=Winogradskyella luteola TaxID=2828330 RepID=A0A9X1JQ41_9FLAO|nr:glycosyltransferase family 4 protein [Winogradskyella luteola]MBV7268553.1 glycosyltransferase family 4 protein [Winogradskyella luteola]